MSTYVLHILSFFPPPVTGAIDCRFVGKTDEPEGQAEAIDRAWRVVGEFGAALKREAAEAAEAAKTFEEDFPSDKDIRSWLNNDIEISDLFTVQLDDDTVNSLYTNKKVCDHVQP